MPDQDGYTFIHRVRMRPDDRRAVPAIAITAYVTERDQARARHAGFQVHVAKPVDLDRLARIVAEICNGSDVSAAGDDALASGS